MPGTYSFAAKSGKAQSGSGLAIQLFQPGTKWHFIQAFSLTSPFVEIGRIVPLCWKYFLCNYHKEGKI